MEEEFKVLVAGNNNFNDMSLEEFSALPEADVAVFFDSTVAGIKFKAKVMVLRNRFNRLLGGKL